MGSSCGYRKEIQMLSEFYADTEVAVGPAGTDKRNMVRSGAWSVPLTAAPLALLLNFRLLQKPDHCQRSVKGEYSLLRSVIWNNILVLCVRDTIKQRPSMLAQNSYEIVPFTLRVPLSSNTSIDIFFIHIHFVHTPLFCYRILIYFIFLSLSSSYSAIIHLSMPMNETVNFPLINISHQNYTFYKSC
jgi:hypothetical protein